MQTIDFCRSYLRFRIDPMIQPPITVTRPMPTSELNVRINLECRCELLNRATGRQDAFVLGASCKTELVGVERNVWMQPNADFCLVVSRDEFLVLKSWARHNMAVEKHPDVTARPQERQSGLARDAWTEYGVKLQPARGRILRSIDEIIAAIRSDCPIVAQTKYDDGDWSVVLEYPVKTINFSERDNVYQTDTGPILLPDLSAERFAKSTRLIDCFDLAFAAFNSANWAECIVNVPTCIGDGVLVNHYSKTRRIEPVQNHLLEVLVSDSPLRQADSERAIRFDTAELHTALKGSQDNSVMGIVGRST